jgi:alcohol dehydrogenase (cytochrome c)
MSALRQIAVLAFAAIAVAGSAPAQNVPYQRILNADKTPQDWLTYGGDYQSHRFSGLTQINKSNVASLRPVWIFQRSQLNGEFFEATPVVADGLMYIVEPPSTVTALDARTGMKIWSWSPKMPKDVKYIGLHANNRGVAILDDMVYVGTLDCHLAALDAKTGALRWIIEVEKNSDNHAISGNPLAIDGKIIMGTGGGDRDARGLLDAYDAKTGKRLWRVWTVPNKGEDGSETWGDAVPNGGDVWNGGSYDPELNLLYYGTGNPSPAFGGQTRPGDNLYTCSLLAIDATTGKIKWHFQFTPHDIHDWDATQIPVLIDSTVAGKPRKLVAMANRNGFYYVLDRVTGEFVAGAPYIAQNWAKGLDEKGRPILLPGYYPAATGTLTNPSTSGANNWTAPSYDPQNKLFYESARELSAVFTPTGSNFQSGDDAYGAIRALDSTTGKQKWQYKLLAPGWVSTLSTAGGLVFSGDDEGDVFALNADTGKLLWSFPLSGLDPRDSPVTYSVGGKQYLVISSINIYAAFGLP